MGDNRHPAGYIPLTYHELGGSSLKFQQPGARDRSGQDDFEGGQSRSSEGKRSGGGIRRGGKRTDSRVKHGGRTGGSRGTRTARAGYKTQTD